MDDVVIIGGGIIGTATDIKDLKQPLTYYTTK